MINWKERHDKLAELFNQLDIKLREMEQLRYRIDVFVKESDRLDLHSRQKCRLMRLKEEVTLAVEYYDGTKTLPKTYTAGTLIECGVNGYICLDDGNLSFPPNLLEPVEIDYDDRNIDWSKVIR